MSEVEQAVRAIKEMQAAARKTISSLPLAHRLKQRKVLPLGDREYIFVDDDGSCQTSYPNGEGKYVRPHVLDDAGFIWTQQHHVYVDGKGYKYAVRCPASLTFEEKDHLMVDEPRGSIEAKMASRREIRQSQRPAKKEEDWE